jgi:DnaK suppressor protein
MCRERCVFSNPGVPMNDKASHIDSSFLEQQRARLLELRRQIEQSIRTGQSQESELSGQALREAQESEDDAQKLAQLEIDGTIVGRDIARLSQVNRALAKMEDGTYGLSDISGRPIPRERLSATPEATDLLQEAERA